jgi:hypothetical protein
MLRTCALILALHLSLATGAQAQTYVARIEDLPLMPGLVEQDGAGLVFDKPEGRIVEAVASGAGTPQAVADYYAKVLPQLGWQRRSDGSYMRENERLAIAARADGSRVTVQFTLSPN